MAERTIDSLIEDFEYWIGQMESATDPRYRRRTADAAIAVAYRVQDALKKAHGPAFWSFLAASDEGRTAGAVTLARNVNTHDLFQEASESELYPGFHPGEDVIPGEDYRWKDFESIEPYLPAPTKSQIERRPWYQIYLSQMAVAPTLRTTASFFRSVS